MPIPDICPGCGDSDCEYVQLIPLIDRSEAVVGCYAVASFDVRTREAYASQDEWRTALEGFAATEGWKPVEATESLRTLELLETGHTAAMPDGPTEFAGGCQHWSLNIHQYIGPLAVCPDCLQPLGKYLFAAGAAWCWQHFNQQINFIDCPNLFELPRDTDVLKFTPTSEAWAAIKDRFPLVALKDED